jgi:hypothetical protein
MLMYSPLSAYFDDVIPQHPALSNDGKQGQPALGDFTSPLGELKFVGMFVTQLWRGPDYRAQAA